MGGALAQVSGLAPTLAMLAAFACLAGGGYLIATGRNRTKGWLMLGLAVVLVGNVVILTL